VPPVFHRVLFDVSEAFDANATFDVSEMCVHACRCTQMRAGVRVCVCVQWA
jgi:hypothetical protein